MSDNSKTSQTVAPEDEEGAIFEPPAGWRRSDQRTSSKFAFEISNTTNWYRNDGYGNGYFAPGWDKDRIARRTGVFRWIGLGLVAVIVLVGAVAFMGQFEEQRNYDRLSSEGVPNVGVIGPVTAEYSSRRAREGSRQYTTTTSASITYEHRSEKVKGRIEHSQTRTRDFLSTSKVASSDQYPEPFWREGETVELYYDPAHSEDFVLKHEYKEIDAERMPRGAWLVLIFTGVFLVVPVLFIIVGLKNVRRAREL